MSDQEQPQEKPQSARARITMNEAGAVQLFNVQDAIDFATWAYESEFLPDHIKNAKQAFTIMQRGAELGLPSFASWRFIYITRGGKMALESKGALAVCQSKKSFESYSERIEGEGEDMRGVGIATRKGMDPTIKEFTYADAKAAGLTKKPRNRQGKEYEGPWQAYLKDMLLSKARERALAIAFAAELGGIPVEGLAEEIEVRNVQRADPSSGVGLRERMRSARAALPETTGSKTSMSDIIRGKNLVVDVEAEPVVPLTVAEAEKALGVPASPPQEEPPSDMEQHISDQVDEALADPPAEEPEPIDLMKAVKDSLEAKSEKAEAPRLGQKPPTTCQYVVGPSALCSSAVVPATRFCKKHTPEEPEQQEVFPDPE